MRITNVEEPSTIVSYLVWIAKDEGEEWGVFKDDVYDRNFIPDKICVIVKVSDYAAGKAGRYWSDWAQVRQDRGSLCVGTHELSKGGYDKQWARDAQEVAIEAIRQLRAVVPS